MGVFARPQNERIGALATLPVFFELRGKKVLLAGGSEGAAWKAELLAAAGAEVHVFCPSEALSPEMLALMSMANTAPPSVGCADISPTRGESGPAAISAPAHDVLIVGERSPSVYSPPLWGRCPEGTEGGGDLAAVAKPSLIHHAAPWHAAHFKSFVLAVGDCETEQEARLFHERAAAAGIPVNVIDKPEFCQFKFGSIVNRSPVVIGISTDGAAPILGQAIRRRIETLLPQSLKSWAELAQSLRARVTDSLTSPQRRNFWERFVDRAFLGNEPEAGAASNLITDADRISIGLSGEIGTVTLVGAGPGDAELLTLKAIRALQAADVILFDDLVSAEVLELARREARRMLVGKRGGRESCNQADINDMMVRFAKSGKRVVRLKSGDPMIFGRAGEEIARLRAEGIPVEIVPGITSASAMAARLGVSLTHRDHAQSVRFVTGHSRKGELPANIDWKAMANPTETTIFYMGGRTASCIRQHLLEAGMAAETPVVVMTSIARANEQRWAGSLDQLAVAVDHLGIDEPLLIGIGQVFGVLSAQILRKNSDATHPLVANG